jgi:uncharacterized protein (TIGR02391 family)
MAAPEIKQFRTPEEIDHAISKFRAILAEVSSFDPDETAYNDQRVHNAEYKIRDSILEIFGPRSPEYLRHLGFTIMWGDLYPGMRPDLRTYSFEQGLARTKIMLEGIINNLEEKRADLQHDTKSRAITAFEDLDLHPRIAAVAIELFRDGHYRNAVLDACVALVNFVKEKSRCHDLDGANLMRTVFSKSNPILAFNELKDQSGSDEQEGLMHLFEGAVLALRNPRAHELTPDSPEAALDYIALLNLLAKRLDQAKKRSV